MRPITKLPNLLYWMRSFEGVCAVRVTDREGQVKVLKLNAKSKRPFSEMKRTVEALKCECVEVLDKTGNVLGALQFPDPEEEAEAEEQAEQQRAVDAVVATHDARIHEMQAFAAIIADAYKHSTNVAFDKFVDVFRIQNEAASQRQVSLEKSLTALERTLSRQSREMARAAAEGAESSTEDDLMTTVLTAMTRGNAEKQAEEVKNNGVMRAAVRAAAHAVADEVSKDPPEEPEPEGGSGSDA